MGLPRHATIIKVLTMVASATQGAAVPPITEGKKTVPVCCIIG